MLLLIGNGPSGDTPAVAAAMGRAARVLRMNNWEPGVHTGNRCDIWGTSFNIDIVPRPHLTAAIWWTGWPYGCGQYDYDDVLAGQVNHFDSVANRTLIKHAYARLYPCHPSTGVLLALMAALCGESVALAGFDHFSAPTHHYWTKDPAICNPLQFHDPDGERRIIRGLKAELIAG